MRDEASGGHVAVVDSGFGYRGKGLGFWYRGKGSGISLPLARSLSLVNKAGGEGCLVEAGGHVAVVDWSVLRYRVEIRYLVAHASLSCRLAQASLSRTLWRREGTSL